MQSRSGFCGAPDQLVISSIFPHFGEEPPISGTRGSGTVFFSHCTLKCCYCQNYQISHEHKGDLYTVSELADEFLNLEKKGCHNINLVTATHFLPWVISALKEAAFKGLQIPIVYNCGGYETEEIISILNGIVDIYLPDMKYGNNESAECYSRASDYVEVNQKAVRAMFRQVGVLKTDSSGIAYRGMCIRHLVLPNNKSSSIQILQFLKSVFDPQDISLSLMAQYKPLYMADRFAEINRTISIEEYKPIRDLFSNEGFYVYFQDISEMDNEFVIDFTKRKNEALTGE